MAWRKVYLDLIMIPLALVSSILYHCWLWYVVRTRPNKTCIGVNSHNQRVWVRAMLKDNDKKNILAVQTLRNYIMGSTLVATTTVLLCASIFAFDSRATYGPNYNHGGASLGGRGEPQVAYKFAALLLSFVAVFACQFLSIGFLNQVGILINIITMVVDGGDGEPGTVTPELVCVLLEKGLLLNTVGTRLLYTTLPLTLWIFGATPVFLCSLATVPILYRLDIIPSPVNDEGGSNKNGSIPW